MPQPRKNNMANSQPPAHADTGGGDANMTLQASASSGKGLRLMRNLSIGRKMAMVVGAMLVPLLALLGLHATAQIRDLRFVHQQIDGLAYYHPLEEIGGAVDMRSAAVAAAMARGVVPDLSAVDAQVAREMAAMDVLDGKYGRPESRARWKQVHADWDTLRNSRSGNLEDSIAAHQAFIAKLADLRTYIATEWGMALDPVAESHYALDIVVARIPEIENQVGGTLALLAGASVGNGPTSTMREQMIRYATLIEDRITAVNSGLDVIDARAGFGKVESAWSEQLGTWISSVEQAAIRDRTTPAEFRALAEAGEAIPMDLDRFHDTMMEATGAMVERRSSGELHSMLAGLALVLVLCASAVFLSHSLGWRIIGAIRRLRGIAARIATGDFTNHIDSSGQDEIARLFGAIDQMQVQLREDLETRKRHAAEIRRMSGGLAATSASVMIADSGNNIIYLNEAAKRMFGDIESELRKDLPAFSVDRLVGQNIDVFHKNPAHQQRLLDRLSGSHPARFVAGGRHIAFTASPIFGDAGERLGTVVEWVDRTAAVNSEKEIDAAVDAFLKGDLSHRVSEQGKTGFHELIAKKMNMVIGAMAGIAGDVQGIVAEASRGDLSRRVQTQDRTGLAARLGGDVNELVDAIGTVVDEVQKLVVAANDGDLTRRIDTAGKPGLLVRIGAGINDLTANMAEVVSKVKLTAGEVHRGAEEISQGNTDLSQRTEQQASSLEQTASSMEEMTSTVRQNAENAGQANQLAVAARDQAEKGGAVVARAVKAMGEINDASRKIADIIGVIDEIAFQTNLLALNAAVEAARAGEQGRGFAVVASEVRSLAGRSATAAKEIKALIQDSVQKVDEGSNLVTQSGATLEQIVAAVKKVSDIVAEIAAASAEQSAGIDQVNKAVMQLDELTQQNAALVEQASAASQSMAGQARDLTESMSRYRVQDAQLAQAVLERPVARAVVQPERRKPAVRGAVKAPTPSPSRPKVVEADDDAVWKEF
jgi:methyl-accepting chemotaxis protein